MSQEVRQDIQVGSIWRNNKKGTLYRVWAIVVDDSGDRFVVYQESSTPIRFVVYQESSTPIRFVVYQESSTPINHQILVVRHSETDRSGFFRCSASNDVAPKIHWDKQSTTGWDNDTFNSFAAWARPIAMWHEKFTFVSVG